MNGKIILVILIFSMLSIPASGWGKNYYVMLRDDNNVPVIDGTVSSGEWTTDEQSFTTTVDNLIYEGSEVTSYSIQVTMLRDSTYLYLAVMVDDGLNSDHSSLGISIASRKDAPRGMASYQDRKVIFANGGNPMLYDLYNCLNGGTTDPCLKSGAFQPGLNDTTSDPAEVKYAYSQGSFELRIILHPANTTEDVSISKEGTYINFVYNPKDNIMVGGDGAKGAGALLLSWEPRNSSSGTSLLDIGISGIMICLIAIGLFSRGKHLKE